MVFKVHLYTSYETYPDQREIWKLKFCGYILNSLWTREIYASRKIIECRDQLLGLDGVMLLLLLKVLQAIEAENQQLRVPEVSWSPTFDQRPPEDHSEESPTHKNDATPSASSTKLHTSRSLVNFVAAKQQTITRKAAAKTKKRGEVMHLCVV